MPVPEYSHIVVVVEENHDYSQIIGNSQAPYINSLAFGGALLTNYDALSHPSEPNYFGLYAGSTFGITDDNHYSEPDPTLYTVLNGAGKTFTGYVETTNDSYDHNPWESFPEGFSVEKDFSTFPTSNFASLPTVSFVIPNVDDDMHSGTIQQGDTWLQNNINNYAQWAKNNNSLLVVTWDENDGTDDGNHVATIFYGADVKTGTYATAYNHYNLLSTLLASYGLTGPRNAGTAAPIDVFGTGTGGTLAGQVLLSTATEGTAIPATTTIASFTDSNASDTAAEFTATITWGDGTTSAGTISGGSGSFAVTGGHTYTDEGSDPLSVAITPTAGSSITPSGTVAVAEGDTLTAHATTITATAGQALSNATVASFTDVNTGAVAGDFTATVNWGDGATTAGTITGGNGTFTVSGSHTYTNPGTDTVSVTLADDAPGTASATATSTAQVGSGAGNLAGHVLLSTATEGTAITDGTTIASFTDKDHSDTAAGFTAVINWGDGTSSTGRITGRKGTFAVTGGHTYTDEGSDPLSVVITRSSDHSSITPTGTVTVAEGDTLTPHATTITATPGQVLSNVNVASFTDVNTGAVAGDFTATVNWGDGATTAGTITGGNGTFTVSGSHTYANPGTDTVSVTLADDAPSTASATATSTAQVGSGGGGGGGGQTISSSVAGPIHLSGTNAVLTVTSTGTVTTTGASGDGVDGSPSGPSTITNFGTIKSVGGGYSAGIWLENGGTVTNAAGASISATYGVEVSGSSGVVTNSGTISGSQYAVLFANSANDRLIVQPAAVFNGPVQGGSGSNTLELAGGSGSIAGLSGGSGTVTQNGTWSFSSFGTLQVDNGADWTLNGGDIPNVIDNGTIAVAGSLHVSSAVGPMSSGIFQLTSGATLDVAAALGNAARMSFAGPSELVIDNPLSFGTGVGSSSYAGPLLEDFGAGAGIDLEQFGAAGAATRYDATTGILQLFNNAGQAASLAFQPSSLGAGAFHVSSDGGSGILLTNS